MSGRHEAGTDRPGDELERFRRETIFSITQTDEFATELLLQVLAIEEVYAARWPRRILVRARLGRELRRSVAHIDGATFAEKRINTISSGWLERRR